MKHIYFLILVWLAAFSSYAQTTPNNTPSEINTDRTISISEENEIRLYPNPATGNHITIVSKNVLSLEVFDILGKKVAIEKINSRQQKLDISNLKSGIYLVRFTSETATETRKLIIP